MKASASQVVEYESQQKREKVSLSERNHGAVSQQLYFVLVSCVNLFVRKRLFLISQFWIILKMLDWLHEVKMIKAMFIFIFIQLAKTPTFDDKLSLTP